jgi:hypothetical protein
MVLQDTLAVNTTTSAVFRQPQLTSYPIQLANCPTHSLPTAPHTACQLPYTQRANSPTQLVAEDEMHSQIKVSVKGFCLMGNNPFNLSRQMNFPNHREDRGRVSIKLPTMERPLPLAQLVCRGRLSLSQSTHSLLYMGDLIFDGFHVLLIDR